MAVRVLDEFVNKLGFKYDNKGLDAFKKGVKVATQATLAIGAAVIGAATGAFIFGGKIAKVADETSKFSRQIGIDVEALQELEFAADRQGISNDKLRFSFQFLNRSLAALRRGQGMLQGAFEKSNPELLSQLTLAKDTEAAFEVFVRAVEKAPDTITKAGIANALFGRSGQEMLRIAEAGTKGIRDLRQEYKAFGGVMSRDTAKNAEVVIDKLTNLRAIYTGVKNTLADVLFPVLIRAGNALEAWYKSNKKIIDQKIENYIKKVSKGWKIFSSLLLPFIKRVQEIGALWKGAFKGVKGPELFSSYIKYLKSIFDLFRAITNLIMTIFRPALIALKPVFKLLEILLKPLLEGATYVFERIADFVNELTNTLEKLGGIYKAIFGKVWGGLKKIAGARITPADVDIMAGGGGGAAGVIPSAAPMTAGANKTVNNNVRQDIKFEIRSTDPRGVADEIEERLGRIQDGTVTNLDKGGFS